MSVYVLANVSNKLLNQTAKQHGKYFLCNKCFIELAPLVIPSIVSHVHSLRRFRLVQSRAFLKVLLVQSRAFLKVLSLSVPLGSHTYH